MIVTQRGTIPSVIAHHVPVQDHRPPQHATPSVSSHSSICYMTHGWLSPVSMDHQELPTLQSHNLINTSHPYMSRWHNHSVPSI